MMAYTIQNNENNENNENNVNNENDTMKLNCGSIGKIMGSYDSIVEMLSRKEFNTTGYQIKIPLEHLLYRLRRSLYFLDLNEYKFSHYVYVPKYYNIDLYGYMGDSYSDSDTMLKWFNENNKTVIYYLSKIYVFSDMIVGYMIVNNKSLKVILATSKKSQLDKKYQLGTSNINLYKGKKYVISSIPLVLNGAIRCNVNNKVMKKYT